MSNGDKGRNREEGAASRAAVFFQSEMDGLRKIKGLCSQSDLKTMFVLQTKHTRIRHPTFHKLLQNIF